jgi:uncharacterized membrane protein YcaP (DUF421 family)
MFISYDPTLDAIARGLILGAVAMVWVILLIRLNGLRSLSKMTNFDFVMTVAMGSLVASAAQVERLNAFVQIAAAMAGLFVFQNLTARLRRSSEAVEDALQNDPILLMKNGQMCHAALKAERVSESDVLAKLREANALDMSKVKAVILETTGDISVLHGDADMDPRLTENIRENP